MDNKFKNILFCLGFLAFVFCLVNSGFSQTNTTALSVITSQGVDITTDKGYIQVLGLKKSDAVSFPVTYEIRKGSAQGQIVGNGRLDSFYDTQNLAKTLENKTRMHENLDEGDYVLVLKDSSKKQKTSETKCVLKNFAEKITE